MTQQLCSHRTRTDEQCENPIGPTSTHCAAGRPVATTGGTGTAASTPPAAVVIPAPTIDVDLLFRPAGSDDGAHLTDEKRSATQMTIAHLQANRTAATSSRIQAAVKEVALSGGSAMVDSHALADLIFEERATEIGEASWGQTKDYVKHILREASHVCRHADGHFYQIHAEATCSPTCSPTCDTRWAQRRAATEPPRTPCPNCFIMLPKSGVCGCED